MADKLSQEELAELKSAFGLFDKDGDGFINSRELKQTMGEIGKCPSDIEIEQMINEVDIDRDGKINFPEFTRMMCEHMKKNKQTVTNDLRTVFKLFDRNGDGLITSEEFKLSLAELGEDMADSEVEEMIQEADIDGDGKVNLNEFMAIMQKKEKS